MTKANPYKRRRIRPLPVELLLDNPAFIALPVAGRGILITLCLHFWQTECRAMPTDTDTLFGIARAHRPTWQRYHIEIMAIFEAWSHYAKAERELSVARRDNLLRLGQRAVSLGKVNHLRKQAALAPAYETATDLALITPPKRAASSPPQVRHVNVAPSQATIDATRPKRLTDR